MTRHSSAVVVRDAFDADELTATLWERRVVRFRAGALPVFSLDDAFAAALSAVDACRRRTFPPGARPPVQLTCGRRQLGALGPWGPRPADRSFAGYEARARALAGRDRYALVVTDLHSHSFALWDREQAFLSALWRRLGLPLSGAITTLFHGNYEHTPIGVHRDRFGTFLFLLRGAKRMRFWAERPWREPVSSKLDYQQHLARSFAVDLEPGEVLYWPSSYYHVGESASAAPATSVNIGIPLDEHHTSYYLDDLALGSIDELDLAERDRARSRLRSRAGDPAVRGALAGATNVELPAPLAEAIAAFGAFGDPSANRSHIRALWLRRASAVGLEPPPAPAAAPRLTASSVVSRATGYPVYWTSTDDGGLVVAGNGHSARIAATAATTALARRLVDGEPAAVRAWLAGLPARGAAPDGDVLPATRAGALRLLERLVSFRVLTVARRSRRSRR